MYLNPTSVNASKAPGLMWHRSRSSVTVVLALAYLSTASSKHRKAYKEGWSNTPAPKQFPILYYLQSRFYAALPPPMQCGMFSGNCDQTMLIGLGSHS